MPALLAFDALARLGGVRRAAQALGIDHSAVSRQVRNLERWTGKTLVARSGRSLVLTDAGRRYHAQMALGLDAIASATLDLIRDGNARQLSIWCVPGLAYQWLSPRLDSFRSTHPEFDVELRPSDMAPDFGLDLLDVDIRHFEPGRFEGGPPQTRAVVLCDPPVFPVASPDYLSQRGRPRTARDLLDHTLIHEKTPESWRLWLLQNGVSTRVPINGPKLWQGHLTMDAARRGQGVALSTQYLAGDDIAAGRLVELTPTAGAFACPPSGPYVLIVREQRWLSPPIVRFSNWLKAMISAESRAPRS